MNNLFKKQSAKFVQNPSSFTKVMAKHILVCFLCPTVYLTSCSFRVKCESGQEFWRKAASQGKGWIFLRMYCDTDQLGALQLAAAVALSCRYWKLTDGSILNIGHLHTPQQRFPMHGLDNPRIVPSRRGISTPI